MFAHNLILPGSKQSLLLEAQGGPEKSSARLTQSDSNAYFLNAQGAQTPFARWAKEGGEPRLYGSLADFQADEPGHERLGSVRQGDPFVDAARGDYHLKAAFSGLSQGAFVGAEALQSLPADVAALASEGSGKAYAPSPKQRPAPQVLEERIRKRFNRRPSEPRLGPSPEPLRAAWPER